MVYAFEVDQENKTLAYGEMPKVFKEIKIGNFTFKFGRSDVYWICFEDKSKLVFFRNAKLDFITRKLTELSKSDIQNRIEEVFLLKTKAAHHSEGWTSRYQMTI